MCVVCDRDEKLGVDDIGMTTVQVLWSQRVHVVYENFVINRKTIDPEVITAISSNYVMTNRFPFVRAVEFLIEKSVVPKGNFTDSSSKL